MDRETGKEKIVTKGVLVILRRCPQSTAERCLQCKQLHSKIWIQFQICPGVAEHQELRAVMRRRVMSLYSATLAAITHLMTLEDFFIRTFLLLYCLKDCSLLREVAEYRYPWEFEFLRMYLCVETCAWDNAGELIFWNGNCEFSVSGDLFWYPI